MLTDFHPRRLARVLLVPGSLLITAPAWAASGAFVVDDAATDEPNTCTAQLWGSAASNHDFITVAYPTCAVDLGKAVEFGALLQRSRAGDLWSTSGTFTAKTNLVPADKQHPFGVGIAGGSNWDLINGASTGGFIYVPVTIPVNDKFKINLNGGWLYDNVAKISYATWGAGFEWMFADKFTLIGEAFGQIGALPAVDLGDPPSPNSIREPRSQIGLRFSPQKNIDIDMIWGHNITGENAQWATLGLNVRFDLGH